jgi:phosphomethylpyrimidine synthase
VLDPFKFDEIRNKRMTKSEACSMCGDLCAMQIVSRFLDPKAKADDGAC